MVSSNRRGEAKRRRWLVVSFAVFVVAAAVGVWYALQREEIVQEPVALLQEPQAKSKCTRLCKRFILTRVLRAHAQAFGVAFIVLAFAVAVLSLVGIAARVFQCSYTPLWWFCCFVGVVMLAFEGAVLLGHAQSH